jgi:hypothetical protein
VVFLLVLADLGVAAVLASRNASSIQLTPAAASPKAGGGQQQKAAHPCNHGYYVSQAAHAKKGGQYTSGIAQSDLGKNGSCTAPLPAQAPPKRASGS